MPQKPYFHGKVYVLDPSGKPLMPTTRYKKVRELLAKKLAKVVDVKPFTIRLLYETKTHITQPVRLGIDPGRTNIGLSAVRETDGEALFRATCKTRNKEIPDLMAERRIHRQASRAGERKVRVRRATANGTLMKHTPLLRALPGYSGGKLTVKGIMNTEARFNNRSRPAGWLTPTVRQLMQTHTNLVDKICRILPITSVAIEANSFDFQALDNPHIQRWQYQRGQLHEYGSLRDAIISMQDGKCLLCRKDPIEHLHHLVPKSKGGSNTLPNLAGLCARCHTAVHTNAKMAEQLSKEKTGMNKKYHALSCLNQIFKPLLAELTKRFPDNVHVVDARSTKQYRDAFRLPKEHSVDAYSIACITLDRRSVYRTSGVSEFSYEIVQFRCHNRARITRSEFRKYYLDRKKVAQNRRPACQASPGTGKGGKSVPSLEEWVQELSKTEKPEEVRSKISKLQVKPGKNVYNDPKRVLPGAIFYYKNHRYVKTGQRSGGAMLHAYGYGKKDFPKGQCKVRPKTGLVFV